MRLGINRYTYKIPSGVYAIGTPEKGAPMFVTCNYKLTVDLIRSSLADYNCFLLVLDTDGINVWCAAGKGTFSSRELIYQLHKHQVKKTLGVRTVYLPQLGASTMEPHLVRQYTGVQVKYGPVDGKDLPNFIENGFIATKEMRRVTFTLKERMILAPLEMILYSRYAVLFILFTIILNAISSIFARTYTNKMLTSGIEYGVMGLVISTIIFPLMLPILPFKSFSYNGYLLAIILIVRLMMAPIYPQLSLNILFVTVLLLFIGYVTFNYTGSTPFTSQSGVEIEAGRFKKECKISLGICMMLVVLEVLM